MKSNGWNEYKKLILHELQENTEALKTISVSITEMKQDISGLKVKAALVGGIAGVVGTALVTAVLSAFKMG